MTNKSEHGVMSVRQVKLPKAFPFLLAAACLLAAAGLPARAAAGELVFGVYPVVSASEIAAQYAPLREHLARALDRPVSLRSAPDFERFIDRTRLGEYDLIFTAPHMGRLAEKRDGYLPLAQTGYSIAIVVIARRDGPVRQLADLRGHSLAVGARLSMSYQLVDLALGEKGIEIGRDVRFVDTRNFSNVFEALVRKEADAGATGTLLWEKLPPEKRNVLREVWRSKTIPGFLLLAHSRLGAETLGRLRQALHDFAATAAGKAYFAQSQQIDFRPVDEATLRRIDPYTAVLTNPDPPR
ncbi:MAG: phosphate/phosphite/phosphonate ABC transporter substrate-binding protein [Sulfuritalea sp.]|nr:phosphate/phosphite/phosphonate ABC transporter substrate-binding protein [Sulfuritalea sp.]